MEVVLASASPRRSELLHTILPRFRVIPAAGEERADLSLPPEEIVKSLARAKAREVASAEKDALVIGADTIVYFEGKVLGKPKDEEDAARMLRALSGRGHEVYTGYCLFSAGKEICGAVCSRVLFRDLNEEYIRRYVAGGSPLDKAGSYGIQDEDGPVLSFGGSYTNIIGLPVEEIGARLAEFGVLQ